MANQLQMAVIDTILTLHARDWSNRRIADTLGIHRDTVARYLRQAAQQPKPAIPPTGPLADADTPKPAIPPTGLLPNTDAPKPAIAPTGSDLSVPPVPESGRVGRPSDCEPWRAVILAKLELGLSAQRISQDLTTDHGSTASYYSVRGANPFLYRAQLDKIVGTAVEQLTIYAEESDS